VAVTGQNSSTLSSYDATLVASGTVDLSSAASSQAALTALDADVTAIASSRTSFGGIENRFDSIISNGTNAIEKLEGARSRIMDADMAQETARYARLQILQQASISMLAQANMQPQMALSLLG